MSSTALYKYDSKSRNANEFINDEEILKTISQVESGNYNIREILDKAKDMKGLEPNEALALLLCNDKDAENEMFEIAKKIKLEIYGKRIVLFAPLYLSNYCINGCVYCPYHAKNKHIARKQLTQDEIKAEVIALQDMGHKRLALETGEDPDYASMEYLLESIKTIYSIKHKNGAIRRVNVNIAATTVENYKKLKDAGIGTYVLFQETYHKPTYEKVHPSGPKSNYEYHTEAMDRAMEGGIDDVGIGVLFGLYDYKYDFTAMLYHAKHLEDTFGCGPHTISVPRIRPADDVDVKSFPNAITDSLFKKIVAVLRIAVPYTGIIVSTRESQKSREEVLEVGVSQISGGSRTSVGGYVEEEEENSKQFEISDNRSLDDIIKWLSDIDYLPSFCTACYREGRTGDRFMAFAKSGQIKNFCQANAIITLKEYENDYAKEETKKSIDKVIINEIEKVPNEKVKSKLVDSLKGIDEGRRDFKF
ncbi:[FeFe] hydrogenase H-cluster radical SAM maturase HydG [Brachyspira hyodysenteriae]|uniref:[FeFe] hydrogenase H-cluster radical SAM maturase HydG n=1 Tax=Brachyspira hyodysenteriae TaxID=159 RepID=UPI0022CD9D6A|nr:[FeFe] hydrogenase H-cluster radical SAM maturase HydG [Brachyspira hyodysenteriae]MCZ9840370.1 [FeFe] hydrogenase H-cluster radical SAM maturase HydG [Brachyspira hyodysenteriae]MCZ9848757.1 [FeFe] hydrogenase H-cluster radical SAM maturase HydG [Brachyspira hyodysenteriae]MCZ9850501.1 [FeFe] hydrogenase H-cluster radical SAM maturase HydG [Brachyspira hyodysenteriae]MCZ9860747.1 [FeFe] hydrogenase H-cluster radical SAM maturase HydG [Brachyspira hyodysenteriae]MCZ9872118.1 [FeFe] hydrogen